MSVVLDPVKASSKEAYYLSFNRDEIFKNLIASEGHFRNFNSLKEDSTGFLNCIVKHLADAEGHCDEAVSHAIIAENSETSKRFLELREEIKSLRKWVQTSPVTRDEGIREIRKLRRSFEGFNSSYDVSKCETCGDSTEIMKEVTKILSDLKNNLHPIAAHEIDVKEFLVMEREMAEKVIAKLSKKYGVEPPELVISDKCHAPMIGLYTGASMETPSRIMMCKTGVNLHVLAHEFWHHVQSKNGMHLDEGDAEKFAVDFFKSPSHKGLYAFHSHSHNERKMAIRNTDPDLKDVGVIYGGQLLGYSTDYALQYLDTLRPGGWMGQPISFWGDLLGSVGGVLGALYLDSPLNLLSALVGGYLATDLVNHIIRLSPVAVVAVTPTVYTPPMTYATPAVRAPTFTNRGTYVVT